ncbi:unnamed protein product [Prorocentrum cordatum]|uniref:Protein kinase domain-containing protein n=1 Tax=Prorocentrum cordatum TaxID=2364126 RepID=A0ABN9W941_9DINO|nr:unnamed protein product [Polarella glacialis]
MSDRRSHGRLLGRMGPWCRRACGCKRYRGGIDRLTMTFKHPGLETGFLISRRQRLSEWLSLMIILTFLMCLGVAQAQGFWNPDQYPTHASAKLSVRQPILFLSGMMVVAVVLCVAKVLARSRLSHRNVMLYMEFGTISVSLIMMLVTIGMSRYYLARMSGYENPEEVWGCDLGYVDGLNLVLMNLLVACGHLAPIRWACLLPLEFALVLMFELPIYVWGSPAPEAVPFFTICAVCLSVIAAAGKRQSELQERLIFKALLAEKKLRFVAEHELAMQQEPASAISTEVSALGDSRPETTTTALAFEMDQSGSLMEIRAIGIREQWLIEDSEVKTLPDRVLGTGGFGRVVAGLYHNTPVAVKVPRQDIEIDLLHASLPALCNELRILRRLRHPNIVFLYGATICEHGASCGHSAPCTTSMASPSLGLCLVLERVDGVSLRQFITREGGGGEALGHPTRSSITVTGDRARIVLDILNALRYLHSRSPRVVHGDLKDSNIFVQQVCLNSGTTTRAKLLDFGLARLLTRSAQPLGGTKRWMAPELFEKNSVPPDGAADVYSLGLLMFFIATGRVPFEDVRTKELARKRAKKRPLHLSWPTDGRGELQSLQCWCIASVERCTQVWPEQRPGVEAVCDELSRGLGTLGAGARLAEEDGSPERPGASGKLATDGELDTGGAPDPGLAPVHKGVPGRGAAALVPPSCEPVLQGTKCTL